MPIQLLPTSLQCSGPPVVQLAHKDVHVLQPGTNYIILFTNQFEQR